MSYADMRIPHGPLLAAFDYGAPVCVCFAFSADRYLLFAITWQIADYLLFGTWVCVPARSCAFLRIPRRPDPTP